MSHLLALDPLLRGSVTWSVFLVVIIKVAVAFVILLVAVMLYIWAMRKVIADMQNRIGPNRAGPYGVLQTLADGIKLFFKEQSIPDSADRPVFRLAPYLSIMPAFLMFCVVPIGGTVSILGHLTYLQVVDLPMGALFILAMSGLGVYGVMLAGWSSGSKYPLLGSVRAVRAAPVVRSGLRSRHPRCVDPGRDALDARHRRATTLDERVVVRDPLVLVEDVRGVRDLPDRRDGRDEPPAVRSRRGRTGARRRLQHRVHGHPLRDLLPRRVHERDHDVGDRGHAVPRRSRPGRASVGSRRPTS